jgi:hypothetical protein
MAQVRKALVAAFVAAVGVGGTALQDGVITGQEWLTVAAAVVAAGYAVWRVPNAPAGRRD